MGGMARPHSAAMLLAWISPTSAAITPPFPMQYRGGGDAFDEAEDLIFSSQVPIHRLQALVISSLTHTTAAPTGGKFMEQTVKHHGLIKGISGIFRVFRTPLSGMDGR